MEIGIRFFPETGLTIVSPNFIKNSSRAIGQLSSTTHHPRRIF
ncbi:hypothetical protein QUB68_19950 [Microcoleus sp. A006_D1]